MSIRFKYFQAAFLLAAAFGSCAGGGSESSRKPIPAAEPKVVAELQFNADSAYAFTARQVDFGPRIPGTKPHAQCGEYIKAKLEAFGVDTVMVERGQMTDATGKPVAIANIFAQYNPQAEKRILLLAHYDTRPWADADPEEANRSKPVPGANDGASGVGVLMEIARQLGQSDLQIGVDFIFTDAEDMGVSGADDESSWCLGTQYWVEHMPYAVSSRPAYGILLDMVGNPDAMFRREYVSEMYARNVNNRVWAVAKASGFGDRFVDGRGGAVTDDHTFINRAGIPCIDIVDCVNPQTGSFPANWHTVNDDMNQISKQTLKAVGQTVLNTITLEKP
ncbi:MAG: M28 family peptidase [Muribaculum sp.]|nr:M28 family peptidase [Muribaculaceae bacterium]MCM1081662.1 M28 family peptidase [Muribaculum sp.]